jgi:HEPN domain-containing protein/predicted nucleotidyltransferase
MPYPNTGSRPVPAEADVQAVLARITAAVGAAVRPHAIILFGSRARGTHRPDSDIDLVVVLPPGIPYQTGREAVSDAYRPAAAGYGHPIDVVVVPYAEWVRYREVPGTVVKPAAHEGRVLWGAIDWPSGVSAPEPPPYGEVAARWAERAEADYLTAIDLLSLEKPYNLDGVCFHAQQAAEKYLKAYYVQLGRDFPFTHDIDELVAGLPAAARSAIDPADSGLFKDYAVETRYAEKPKCPDRETAARAAAAAGRVRAEMRKRLP